MYILHHYPDTASLILRLILRELDQPYAERLIDRASGALDSAAYRALHPMGKIPAMETPDGAMFETAAMLLYLSDRHGNLAPKPGDPARAAFLKWFFFTSTYIHPTLMQLFYPDREAGPAGAPMVLTHAAAKMRAYLTLIDQTAATNPAWLSDQHPTILGYYLAVLIRWLGSNPPDHPGCFRSADFPALHRVLTYLESRPAALEVAADESLGPTIFTHPAT